MTVAVHTLLDNHALLKGNKHLCQSLNFFNRPHADWLFNHHMETSLGKVNVYGLCSYVDGACTPSRLYQMRAKTAFAQYFAQDTVRARLAVHSRWDADHDCVWLRIRRDHAVMILEHLAPLPFLWEWSRLVLLESILLRHRSFVSMLDLNLRVVCRRNRALCTPRNAGGVAPVPRLHLVQQSR